jgi:hypothetical protein
MERTDGLLETWWQRGQLIVLLVLVVGAAVAIVLR